MFEHFFYGGPAIGLFLPFFFKYIALNYCHVSIDGRVIVVRIKFNDLKWKILYTVEVNNKTCSK